MREREFEYVLRKYPQLIEDGAVILGQQKGLSCGRYDLLLQDKHGKRIIAELKRGTIDGVMPLAQVSRYHQDLGTERIMIVAPRVLPKIQRQAAALGIEALEVPESLIYDFLKENDSRLLCRLREIDNDSRLIIENDEGEHRDIRVCRAFLDRVRSEFESSPPDGAWVFEPYGMVVKQCRMRFKPYSDDVGCFMLRFKWDPELGERNRLGIGFGDFNRGYSSSWETYFKPRLSDISEKVGCDCTFKGWKGIQHYINIPYDELDSLYAVDYALDKLKNFISIVKPYCDAGIKGLVFSPRRISSRRGEI